MQRRIEMLSEMHSRWQQLQDDIASDAGECGSFVHTCLPLVYLIYVF